MTASNKQGSEQPNYSGWSIAGPWNETPCPCGCSKRWRQHPKGIIHEATLPLEKAYCVMSPAPLPTPSADEEVERIVDDFYPSTERTREKSAMRSALLKQRAILTQQHNAERERIVREGREAVRKRDDQIEELEGQLSHLRGSHAELKSIYDETENERQRFLSELQQLRASLASAESELATAQAEVATLQKEKGDVKLEVSSLRSELQSAQRQLAEMRGLLSREVLTWDSYGVEGSDFATCPFCHAESGAGVLNKGVPHEPNCILHGESNICESVIAMAEERDSLTQQLQSVKEERDAALTLIGDVKTLPENTVQLLRDLNAEFYGAASAHADAFRILPKVADFLSRLRLPLN